MYYYDLYYKNNILYYYRDLELFIKSIHYNIIWVSDPENIQYILNTDTLKAITILLKSDHDETIADVITIFIYLFKNGAVSYINHPEIVNDIKALQNSENKIISNLVSIFLNDIEKFQ